MTARRFALFKNYVRQLSDTPVPLAENTLYAGEFTLEFPQTNTGIVYMGAGGGR